MECEEVRDQFADYLIDNLHEPARSDVRNHLAACESCRAEAEGLKTLWATLGSIPADQPGPELRARFQVMLEAYRHGLDNAPSRNLWQTINSWLAGWWPRQPALQFGLALLLLVVGVVSGWRLRPEAGVQSNGEITELRGELHQMRQMVALSLMTQQSASDRLKGVNWSYRLQQPDSEVLTALLDMLTHDPNVNVRLAVVDALRQFGGQPVVRKGVADALVRQDSPMVQVALIDLVVDLKEKESVDTLRKLTLNEKVDEAVRTRAQKGLEELE
jgi:anti-sigma factor RsiW